MTLETIYTLVSPEQHQWINALCINTLPNKTDEVIVGVSVSGVIKLWTLGFNEPKVYSYGKPRKTAGNDIPSISFYFSNEKKIILISFSTIMRVIGFGKAGLYSFYPTHAWIDADFFY
jgi:hypothetical protein